MNTKQEFSTLVDLLRYRGTHQPEQKAYTFLSNGETETASLTYGQLLQQARAIATELRRLGLAGGERALLLYSPGLEFISAFFGCLYAGVLAVPAFPPRRNQKITRIKAISSDALAKVALTDTSILTDIKYQLAQYPELSNMQLLATDSIANNIVLDWQEPEISSDTIAFLQYTSGSTSAPKGVMVSHGNLLHNLLVTDVGWNHTSSSVMVSWLPTFHDLGLIYGVLLPLRFGFPCYLMPPTTFLQQPRRWLEAISRYRGTHSAAPNFAFNLCIRKISEAQKADLDLSSWKVALNGAEPISPEVFVRFIETFVACRFQPDTLCPAYGLAETTLVVSKVHHGNPTIFCHLSDTDIGQNRIVEVSADASNCQTLIGCGVVDLDTNVAIVHPKRLTRCLPNEIGEIWVSGVTVTQGYWMRPEETEQTFRAYTADTNEGPFLRTGDLGFIRHGQLFITGRLKDVIIIRGNNHYPQDIEWTVEYSHPSLRMNSGAAFGVKVDSEEQLVVVQEVERSWFRKLDVNEVIGDIRQALMAQYELRVYAVALIKPGSIPKTSSGKIMRHACRTKFLEGTLEVLNPGGAHPEHLKKLTVMSVI
ncbi:MAG: fatty acyl-AMP ligase [Scytonematopsis contorta HA4267-MV1]|nr:fatty acyl-AMP ligase [Scytonematopsis contorta HA4267-MV1]